MNNKVSYRLQYTRCGKERCRKCKEGAGHGPYWYAYWSENGRTVSKYIGIRLPEGVETPRQVSAVETTTNPEKVAAQTSRPVLRVYLLGQFRVERRVGNSWRAVDSRVWQRRRARALLGCLLSQPGRRLSREQVIDQLWPDLDVDVAANRLHGAVHELRQILEPDIARPAASRMLRLEHDVLEIADESLVWVDAEEFENLLKSAHASRATAQAEQLLEEAAALYRGNYLLEELYSEWASPRRDALQRAWIGLLLQLAELRAQRGAYASAIETLDRLRTAEPTNETALQRLMILLTQLDRRGEALQIYHQHVEMLQREDDENDPLPETHTLYEELRQGRIQPLRPLGLTATVKATQEAPARDPALDFTRRELHLGRHNQSPLIGREQELATMRHVMLSLEEPIQQQETGKIEDEETAAPWTRHSLLPIVTRARRPHFLLLMGEPGIGKTRLAEELSLEAYTRDWAVAWSRSYEQEVTIPYSPWTGLFNTLLPAEIDAQQASLLHLERLVPLLPPNIAKIIPPPPSSPPSSLTYEQERLHLWEATLGLLDLLSKAHPLLLVFDDLHWSDESSIELLTYLTHHLQNQRILLLATCRDMELAPQHKLRTLIADLQREQTIVTLNIQPLSQSEIRTLVSHLPEDVIPSIETQASGNPFFAEELARFASTANYEQAPLTTPAPVSSGLGIIPSSRHGRSASTTSALNDVTRPQRILPEAIAGVLERRMSRLSRDCQALLGKAAVLGGSFELNQLLPMTNEQSEDTILDLLDEALHAGILTEEGTGLHITYHFWHPLIISHLYKGLSAARRAQLHRRAAEALKIAPAASQQGKAAAIVYHLSRGGGSASEITYYAELAGHQAYRLTAYSEAQQYYVQAVLARLNRALPLPEGAELPGAIVEIKAEDILALSIADQLHICHLLELVAECNMIQGEFNHARHLYTCVLAVHTGEDFQQQYSTEKERYRETEVLALLWREIGNTWLATGDHSQASICYERGTEVLSQAGINSGTAWACLHLRYGAVLRINGNYHQARLYLQEGLEMLENIVEQQQTAPPSISASKSSSAISISQTTSESLPAQLKVPQTRIERALRGDHLEIGYARERLGIVAASVGELSDGIKYMQAALKIYELSKLVNDMARACSNIGAAFIMKGEHQPARTYLYRALDLSERTGGLPTMASVMINLGDIAHRTGDLQEAENWFLRSLTTAEQIHDRENTSWCYVVLAGVEQDQGRLTEARGHLLRAITIARSIKSSRCLRHALVGLGNQRVIEAIAVQQSAPPHIPPSSNQHYRSLLRRAQSTLQRALSQDELEAELIIEGRCILARTYFLLGDSEQARDKALQALQEARQNETMRIIGRIDHLLGQIYAAEGDSQQAEHYFTEASTIFRERGLLLDYARTLFDYGMLQLRYDLESSEVGGRAHLQKAHEIFTTRNATIDLRAVEHALAAHSV